MLLFLIFITGGLIGHYGAVNNRVNFKRSLVYMGALIVVCMLSAVTQ